MSSFSNPRFAAQRTPTLACDPGPTFTELTLQPPFSQPSVKPHTPDFDPRDTASARDNIKALAAGGSGAISNGGPVSLASFMGAAKGPKRHFVNTGMTDAEREETEKLEREMAATKARWANQSANPEPLRGAMSLASLMKGTVGAPSNPVSASVAQRWNPTGSSTSPPPMSNTSASNNQPRSMASAMGSTATGPRLVSPTQHHDQEGPAHANGTAGSFGLPGLARTSAAGVPAVGQSSSSDVTQSPSSKRNSVIERWGRDLPNQSIDTSPRSPPANKSWQRPTDMSASLAKPAEKEEAAPALFHVRAINLHSDRKARR